MGYLFLGRMYNLRTIYFVYYNGTSMLTILSSKKAEPLSDMEILQMENKKMIPKLGISMPSWPLGTSKGSKQAKAPEAPQRNQAVAAARPPPPRPTTSTSTTTEAWSWEYYNGNFWKEEFPEVENAYANTERGQCETIRPDVKAVVGDNVLRTLHF